MHRAHPGRVRADPGHALGAPGAAAAAKLVRDADGLVRRATRIGDVPDLQELAELRLDRREVRRLAAELAVDDVARRGTGRVDEQAADVDEIALVDRVLHSAGGVAERGGAVGGALRHPGEPCERLHAARDRAEGAFAELVRLARDAHRDDEQLPAVRRRLDGDVPAHRDRRCDRRSRAPSRSTWTRT